MAARLVDALLVVALALTAGPRDTTVAAAPVPTTTVVQGGLFVPWDVAFTADGTMLVTERPGRIRVYDSGAPGAALVSTETIPKLQRLRPQRIVVLGGTSAVSAEVETALGAYTETVQRRSGVDRHETAVAVSRSGAGDLSAQSRRKCRPGPMAPIQHHRSRPGAGVWPGSGSRINVLSAQSRRKWRPGPMAPIHRGTPGRTATVQEHRTQMWLSSAAR